jgi:hypothetical protein
MDLCSVYITIDVIQYAVFCDFSESVGGCSQGRLKAINCFVLHLIAAARVISIGPQPLLHGCTVPT